MIKENKPALIASILLVCFLAMSIWLVKQYVSSEKERDMRKWEDRLSVLAEAQKRSVESWLETQYKNLKELSENPLLQIYLTMLPAAENNNSEVQRGQEGHLKNLILVTANRSGLFTGANESIQGEAKSLQEGMAVLGAQGQLLMSTQQFPTDDKNIQLAFDRATRSGQVITHGIYRNNQQAPRLIIVLPVTTIQAERGSKVFPGAVVSVINPANSLYKILSQNWLTTGTDETLLVTGDESETSYLSILDNRPVFYSVDASDESIAANYARKQVGGFALKNDYKNTRVLVTSRNINNTSWVLVQKIDTEEALRESGAHQKFVLTIFLLAVFLITISFIAIWRHSTSVRLRKITDRLAARTHLLNSVSDSIRDHIFLIDNKEKIVFINDALLACVNLDTDDAIGKPLKHIFNEETSKRLISLRDKKEDIRNVVVKLSIADFNFTYHVSVMFLEQGEYKNSTLYVLHDITYLKEVQDKHSRLLEGIIATLVRVTDLHDPHCANHSERTRVVSTAIAEAMELEASSIEMLSMASLLANIGKLYLPKEMLIKMEPLTADDERLLRNNVLDTVEILKELEFDGPVITFIEQKNEHVDGNGYPAGLAGDDILMESKILCVANAFVAMSSARAYRAGKPVKEVLDLLLNEVDKKYDRHVVAALFHVAENRSDWKSWQNVE